jgi:hypothetical protein
MALSGLLALAEIMRYSSEVIEALCLTTSIPNLTKELQTLLMSVPGSLVLAEALCNPPKIIEALGLTATVPNPAKAFQTL